MESVREFIDYCSTNLLVSLEVHEDLKIIIKRWRRDTADGTCDLTEFGLVPVQVLEMIPSNKFVVFEVVIEKNVTDCAKAKVRLLPDHAQSTKNFSIASFGQQKSLLGHSFWQLESNKKEIIYIFRC